MISQLKANDLPSNVVPISSKGTTPKMKNNDQESATCDVSYHPNHKTSKEVVKHQGNGATEESLAQPQHMSDIATLRCALQL